ncbi:MAG: peptide ABC transporter substrate-binding protein [Candidatus Limnocylindrales bacterium]|jgi:ABC-type transport system substrate-binding protein
MTDPRFSQDRAPSAGSTGYGYPVPFDDLARGDRPRRLLIAFTAALLAIGLVAAAAWHPSAAFAARDTVRIFVGGSPSSLDPAVQSDAGSAQVVSQLFESLTAVDSAQHVQPALATSWETQNGGKRVLFHLRYGLAFSDGSPLTASDVVASWMRVLAPAHPSQLASLLDAVSGARAYREGSGPASAVGIHTSGDATVEVDLSSAAVDFPAIVSSPTLAVVPANLDSKPSLLAPGTFVGSGAYVVSAISNTEITLAANSRYWAGKPAISTVHLITDLGGKSQIDEFEAGRLDYTPINQRDGTWIAYDKTLGPALRLEPSPSVEFYGFNTSKAPFSDVHVRRAFEYGIDWRRIVTLQSNPLMVEATGMVPDGVPGHSAADFGPVFDLAKAKSELAAAGFANGMGFPKITLVTVGAGLDGPIVHQLHDNLGIDIDYRALDWATYNDSLAKDPPAFWWMDWVADYPGANDFLGLLLGSGQPNNFGRWSNSEFDAAVDQALSAPDAASMQKAVDQAQSIVQDQAPVIPVDYGAGYSLAAKGLLGALPNSEGLIRYAGLAWAAGS